MDFALQNKINRRIKWLKNDGIKYVSGTVSPAESNHDYDDIESLEKAMAYFAEKGVPALHIQPKWMGSRCQLYLFRDEPEKCFAVSRNGYKIKLDLSHVFADWMFIFEGIETEVESRANAIILDGELLPWKAIGGSLIDREFEGLLTCVNAEVDFLEKYGLDEARKAVQNSQNAIDFITDSQAGMSKKELQKKYPRYETYVNFDAVEKYSIQQERNDLELYEQQLRLYARDGQIEFKAFDILRIDFEDGTFNVDNGWLANTYLKYTTVNYRNPVLIERTGLLVTPQQVVEVAEFLDMLVVNGYEGIMIKPVDPAATDAVHCMKVRNKDYLRIIYGYDYQREEKLKELVRKKRVGKKRKLSHHEYKLGKEMLKLNWNDVDFETKYDTIAKNLLFEIEEENTLDTRL